MQADPEPEVGRLDAELAFDGDDVRCDQEQATAGCVGVGSREEGVELTEDLRRQIAEQRANFDACDSRAHTGNGRA